MCRSENTRDSVIARRTAEAGRRGNPEHMDRHGSEGHTPRSGRYGDISAPFDRGD